MDTEFALEDLPLIQPKDNHNYVAFFLTLACNLKCPYCINLHRAQSHSEHFCGKNLNVDSWIRAANRLALRDDLPLTLQGGEPTLYKGFYRFVNEVKAEIKMDLITNMTFDVGEFIRNVPVWRFMREAPYASIRVSYHPGQNNIDELIAKTMKMQGAGFRIGLYAVEHPDDSVRNHSREVQQRCHNLGLDFRFKEFLGEYNGSVYGSFLYPDAVDGEITNNSECRTTEVIVDPAGFVYKCHADLYSARNPIAHILDKEFSEDSIDEFRECKLFGSCNPCDVKVKTNRFQVYGHTSVEIRNIR
jgi:MoaA/NifB/PqqE/SkfB family radical SAM enzyme